MSRKLQFVGVTPVLCALFCSAAAATVSDAPTVDYVAAAWQNQNTATIECRFIVKDFNQPKTGGEKYTDQASVVDKGNSADVVSPQAARYIRTPDALYREEGGRKQWGKRSGMTSLVEYRSSGKSKDGTPVGRIDFQNPYRPWSALDRIETVLRPTTPRSDDRGTIFLFGWLKYGKVSAGMERIDGHDCWKIEITDTGDCPVKRYEIWVDPTIGFNPRKLAMTSERDGSELKGVVELNGYKEVTPGIWFPTEQVTIRPSDYRTVYTALDLSGGKDYPDSILKPIFASGTVVTTITADGARSTATVP